YGSSNEGQRPPARQIFVISAGLYFFISNSRSLFSSSSMRRSSFWILCAPSKNWGGNPARGALPSHGGGNGRMDSSDGFSSKTTFISFVSAPRATDRRTSLPAPAP